jgi:hypothetical protein
VSGITIPNLTDGANNMSFTWDLYNGKTPVITQTAGSSSTSATQM